MPTNGTGASSLRYVVKQLYKNLIFTGRDYPKGGTYFRDKCHDVFMRNKDIDDPQKIEALVKQGEFVIKEIEALYYLKKYRALRKNYYDAESFEDTITKNLFKGKKF